MKSHIGPSGPGKCSAVKGNCPFGGEDNHFSTIKEAREAYEKRLDDTFGKLGASNKTKARLSEREKELREQNTRLMKEVIGLRAQNGGGVTYDDANPVRAQKRLEEAIAYASSQGNTHLMEKATKAKVLPSGSFTTADGTRVSTDRVLRAKALLNHVDEEREKALAALTTVVRAGEAKDKKFVLRTNNATYSLTVTEGFDENAFAALPPKLQSAISSPQDGVSIELAREKLDAATLEKITTQVTTADYIMGKTKAPTDKIIELDTEGKTTDDKLKAGLTSIGNFYDGVVEEQGKLKASRDVLSEGSNAIKSVASATDGNTFAPARSQWNGILVSGKQVISKAEASKVLTPEQLASITTKTSKPDAEKARLVLGDANFGKIFKAAQVSLRVTEKK